MWRRSNCQTFCRSAILHGVNNIFKPSQSLFQHDLLAKKSCCKKIRFTFLSLHLNLVSHEMDGMLRCLKLCKNFQIRCFENKSVYHGLHSLDFMIKKSYLPQFQWRAEKRPKVGKTSSSFPIPYYFFIQLNC